MFLGDFIWNSGLYSYYVTSVKIRKEDPHMHKKKCEPQEYAAEFIIAVADYLVYLLKSGKKKKQQIVPEVKKARVALNCCTRQCL